jgi:hypothetical protein
MAQGQAAFLALYLNAYSVCSVRSSDAQSLNQASQQLLQWPCFRACSVVCFVSYFSLLAAAPNGVRFKCQVPAGMKAGDIIYVSIPEAPSAGIAFATLFVGEL